MYCFCNDYSEGAHPRVLEYLQNYNLEQQAGYGLDHHSKRAGDKILSWIGRHDADIHFIPGGTQTNLLVISSMLRPHQAVITAETGHIQVHETGAVEATGHKVLSVKSADGKLTPESVDDMLLMHKDEHMVLPGMVYVSNPTEVGTIYSLEELDCLSSYCRKKNLILYLDGARLGCALMAEGNDLTQQDIARLTDVFYIGGTKNGALFGEALVIIRHDLKKEFRYLMKQKGAMLAKGFIMGLQFEALFEDNLYLRLAKHANIQADKIRQCLKKQGFMFQTESPTNQLFPILEHKIRKELSTYFSFLEMEKADETHTVIRLVTSWATTDEAVELFSGQIMKYHA